MGFRKQLKEVKRVVVKVGTSTLTYENGNINLTRIEKLTRILSDMINSGNEVVLVIIFKAILLSLIINLFINLLYDFMYKKSVPGGHLFNFHSILSISISILMQP